MIRKRIGLIGVGTVGEAFLHSFYRQIRLIHQRIPLRLEIAYVCDVNRKKKKIVSEYGIPFISDFKSLIESPNIDIVVELIGGITPAEEIIVGSLLNNKDVVTANKALLAIQGEKIFRLADDKKRSIGFEASVCGAIPLIKSISEGLVGCTIKELYGILNGTTNYILDKMERSNISFSDALREAQSKGFAEKNPSLDIRGEDTLHKLCILSFLCFGIWPISSQIVCEGINNISLLDIVYARELGYRIKLLAIAKKIKDGLELRVGPTLIPDKHPLAKVDSSFNAVFINSYPAGDLFFWGRGAGGVPTASSVIADIVSISLGRRIYPPVKKRKRLNMVKNTEARFYLRFMAKDKPGVLSQIARILASYSISIASVHQKERDQGQFVPIVMLTHEALEEDMRKAIDKIDRLTVIKSPTQLIRIEDI